MQWSNVYISYNLERHGHILPEIVEDIYKGHAQAGYHENEVDILYYKKETKYSDEDLKAADLVIFVVDGNKGTIYSTLGKGQYSEYNLAKELNKTIIFVSTYREYYFLESFLDNTKVDVVLNKYRDENWKEYATIKSEFGVTKTLITFSNSILFFLNHARGLKLNIVHKNFNYLTNRLDIPSENILDEFDIISTKKELPNTSFEKIKKQDISNSSEDLMLLL